MWVETVCIHWSKFLMNIMQSSKGLIPANAFIHPIQDLDELPIILMYQKWNAWSPLSDGQVGSTYMNILDPFISDLRHNSMDLLGKLKFDLK